MMHIDTQDKQPPRKWLKKANKLTVELLNAPDEDTRNAIIDRRKAVWGELRKWLLKLSNYKCWYSDSRDLFSYWHVEHFRPKKRALDLDRNERPGYWWLSFDWKNYRICGNVGNTKKGTYFPLHPNSIVADCPAINYEDESPYFLDPTKMSDVDLITINESGEAVPSEIEENWAKHRALVTIELFRFNAHDPLALARQQTWTDCFNLIKRFREERQRQKAAPSPSRDERVENLMKDILKLTNPKAQLSCVAIACCRANGCDWACRRSTN